MTTNKKIPKVKQAVQDETEVLWSTSELTRWHWPGLYNCWIFKWRKFMKVDSSVQLNGYAI